MRKYAPLAFVAIAAGCLIYSIRQPMLVATGSVVPVTLQVGAAAVGSAADHTGHAVICAQLPDGFSVASASYSATLGDGGPAAGDLADASLTFSPDAGSAVEATYGSPDASWTCLQTATVDWSGATGFANLGLAVHADAGSYGLRYAVGLDLDNGAFNAADVQGQELVVQSLASPRLLWEQGATLSDAGSNPRVAYGAGKFVLTLGNGDDVAWTSADGLSWARTDAGARIDNVAFGGGAFVGYDRSNNTASWSADGVVWSAATGSLGSVDLAYGNGLFVGCLGTACAESTDGRAWTPVPVASSQNLTYTAFGNGTFVTLDQTGGGYAAFTSPDGTTWTPQSFPSTSSPSGLTWAAGKFIAYASAGDWAVSTDGATWQALPAPVSGVIAAGPDLDGGVLAVASYTPPTIYRTADLATWSSVPIATSGATGIAIGGDRAVVAGAYRAEVSGSPAVAASPAAIDFGTVTAGASATKTVTLTNTRTGVAIVGQLAAPAPFAIANDHCSWATLSAGASCTADVRWTAGAGGQGTLAIPTNANAVSIALQGVADHPPSAPALLTPADGATVAQPALLAWSPSTDPDGDAISYDVYVCQDAAFTSCQPTRVAQRFGGSGAAKWALAPLALWFFWRKRRGFAVLLLCVACHSSSGGTVLPADHHETTVSPGAGTWHWKVTADDGRGGRTDSAARTFTVR